MWGPLYRASVPLLCAAYANGEGEIIKADPECNGHTRSCECVDPSALGVGRCAAIHLGCAVIIARAKLVGEEREWGSGWGFMGIL